MQNYSNIVKFIRKCNKCIQLIQIFSVTVTNIQCDVGPTLMQLINLINFKIFKMNSPFLKVIIYHKFDYSPCNLNAYILKRISKVCSFKNYIRCNQCIYHVLFIMSVSLVVMRPNSSKCLLRYGSVLPFSCNQLMSFSHNHFIKCTLIY